MEYPKLYKLSTTGKILEWYLERDGDQYRTVSGQQDGKKTVSKFTKATPKNVGKKNATSAEEQADKECLAKYEKKVKNGGYFDNLENISNTTYTKPMKAESYYSEVWDPETNKVKVKDNRPNEEALALGEYVLQPKLDGVRCIASKEGLFSRTGEKIIGVPAIEEELYKFFELNDIKLDGELYSHEVEFNELSGTIRRDPENDTEEEKKVRDKVKYFVYDIVSDDPYKDRLSVLSIVSKDFPKKVYNLATVEVEDRENITELHDKYVAAGYEGVMLRNMLAPYRAGKRTRDLLKVKQFTDAEYTILDVIEGEGNNSGMAAKLEIEENGVKIYPNMTGSWEFCQQVLENKEEYIGGQVTVKFFGRTPDGSLRHPSVKAIYKGKRDM